MSKGNFPIRSDIFCGWKTVRYVGKRRWREWGHPISPLYWICILHLRNRERGKRRQQMLSILLFLRPFRILFSHISRSFFSFFDWTQRPKRSICLCRVKEKEEGLDPVTSSVWASIIDREMFGLSLVCGVKWYWIFDRWTEVTVGCCTAVQI